MPFERTLLSDLLLWKNNEFRKPLILKGARQVGKTSLLKLFGETQFDDIAYFNFEEQPNLNQLFTNTKDTQTIIKNLSVLHGNKINEETCLIVLDEIQECNEALNSLKYFNENAPKYCIACAGSLLGITLGKNQSFPVGKVDFLELYPLSFYEFLKGAKKNLANFVNDLNEIAPIKEIFFNELHQLFKMYFISGGLPEPASQLVFNNNTLEAEKSLKAILNAYFFDFSKHAEKKDVAKIGYIWNAIPSQLARENKKFIYQTVKPGARAREYEDAIHWLLMAGLIYRVNLCTKPALPLTAYEDLSIFKIYALDVGLLRVMSQLHSSVFFEGNKLFTEFKGALSENYILQSILPLLYAKPKYWTSQGKAEVDFLIQYKNDVFPIEVKADENIKSKSLIIYENTYKPKLRIRYSLKNLSLDGNVLNIPMFLADYTNTFIEQALKKNSTITENKTENA